jgi:tetratricopeptide (TPR) repeat protein
MLAIIISTIISILAGVLPYSLGHIHINWCIFIGITTFLTFQIIIGLVIRKKINKVNEHIQKIMSDGQAILNRKVHAFQQKPVGGVKVMEKILEKEQNNFLLKALEATKQFEPFFHWNILMKKQTNALRIQLYFQLKEYEKVDALLDHALFMDPQSVAIKMTRYYKNKKEDELEKTFKKSIKKFKGDQSVILYALYSWILVKQQKIDEAVKILSEAKEKTENEVIHENWEHLANQRIKRFSNAKLGDAWYSLQLEKPKQVKQKQQRVQQRYR